ncbi:MAG: iron permease FTR1 [Trebouxia sp. A1-2]|nr:MAG: iron permease FTR1 [Trebouxia sp. A1-2]
MANIFSVVALLIMFREALEASIIISVMLQLCDRLKLQPMKKLNAKSGKWGIWVLAFTTTLREGLEAVVFIAGVSAGLPVSSIPFPAVIGIIMGLTVGFILYWTGKKISDIAWFMYGMTGFLFLIAAGLVGRSFVGFESVGWFGYYGFPTSARPWQNQTLWNWSQKCNSNIQTNWECGILYAIFGYQDQGTAIWLFAYFGYWVEIFIVIAFKILSGTLLVAGVKKKQLRKPVLPKVADQVSSSPEDSSKVVSVPKGKEVQPSDFIVGHDTVQQKGKGKHMFEEQAEGSGSSGSSGSSSNPQLQHVEMAAMQVRH